jgi:hypothetical protein
MPLLAVLERYSTSTRTRGSPTAPSACQPKAQSAAFAAKTVHLGQQFILLSIGSAAPHRAAMRSCSGSFGCMGLCVIFGFSLLPAVFPRITNSNGPLGIRSALLRTRRDGPRRHRAAKDCENSRRAWDRSRRFPSLTSRIVFLSHRREAIASAV